MTVLTYLCAAGACQYCAGDDSGPLQCDHRCHGKPEPQTVESWDPPEPAPGPEPVCAACGNSGVMVTADHRGEPCEDACAYCDAPYPVTGDPDAEDPFATPQPETVCMECGTPCSPTPGKKGIYCSTACAVTDGNGY